MKAMKMSFGIVVVGLLVATLAGAETASISMGDLSCLPKEGNGVLKATVTPELGGTFTRMYFRKADQGAFYFVDMRPSGGGEYWGTFPRPHADADVVEYYTAVQDPYGNTLARSDSKSVSVTNDCVADLTVEEQGMANNLTVGETAADQFQKPISWFLCEGVVTRVGSDGVIRGDDICRRCIIAAFPRSALVPILAVPGIIIANKPKPSEFRP